MAHVQAPDQQCEGDGRHKQRERGHGHAGPPRHLPADEGNVLTLRQKLQTLQEVGLGYIRLGQAATTLSGGEEQRVKLSRELSRRSTGRTLYILDEPTTGLHFADIQHLLGVLTRLVQGGNTVLVIEHHLEVIKTADYIIDLGPEGGDGGGHLVATSTPEMVAQVEESYTGHFLREVLHASAALSHASP